MASLIETVEETCSTAHMELVRVGVGYAPVNLESVCTSPIAVTFKRKVIMVYHYDAITVSDVSMATSVSSAMKANTVPLILITAPGSSKLPIKKYHHITFPITRTTLPVKGVKGAEAVLLGETHDFAGDNISFGGVFDNYLSTSAMTIDDATTIADKFSVSEYYSETLCRSGVYSDPYTYLPLTTASLVYRDMRERGVALKGNVKTFGQVWSKTNAMYAKMAVYKKMSQIFTAACGDGTSDRIYGVQQVFATAIQHREYAKAADILQKTGLEAAHALLLMRLCRDTYPPSVHTKVKQEMMARK